MEVANTPASFFFVLLLVVGGTILCLDEVPLRFAVEPPVECWNGNCLRRPFVTEIERGALAHDLVWPGRRRECEREKCMPEFHVASVTRAAVVDYPPARS